MSQPSPDHLFLDGPKFAAWLHESVPDLDGTGTQRLGNTLLRRIWDYRKGACPNAYEVPDRICVALDLHLDDIPDEVWLTKRPRVKGKRNPSRKREALGMLSDGWLPGEVAQILEISPRTVSSWSQEAA